MNDELISVIIPVYNTGRYIGRCLESILGNTYNKLEIICVDDGSTDDSQVILSHFSERDSRVHVVRQENTGLCSARNRGIDCAHGEIIAFIDSDDWIHESYFEWLYRALIEHHADISICDYVTAADETLLCVDSEYVSRTISVQKMASSAMLKDVVWGRLYRRELLSGNRFVIGQRIEDTAFNFSILAKNPEMRVAYLPAKLYAYYKRENSLSTRNHYLQALELASYLEALMSSGKGAAKSYIALEACKRALHARYVFGVLRQRENMNVADRVLKTCVGYVSERKLFYNVFVWLPLTYRLFSVLNDRSMLDYEKKLKQSNDLAAAEKG